MKNQNTFSTQYPEASPPPRPWYKRWYIWVAIGVGATILMGIIGSFMPKDEKNNKEPSTIAVTTTIEETTTKTTTEPTTVEQTTAKQTTVAPTTQKPTELPTEAVPREYQNAMNQAESYLNYSSFSKEGLYDQLIFEKYSEEAARYAVDNINTDWNENAVKKAESYLAYSAFSKDALYDQLIYEKFTPEQAQYAVDKVY